MATRHTLTLTAPRRRQLERLRDTGPNPSIRRRATALLLIADGQSAYWVACHGLDKPVSPDQVYAWLNRYEAEGIDGLKVRKGRGRKPACFPLARQRTVRAHHPSGGPQPPGAG